MPRRSANAAVVAHHLEGRIHEVASGNRRFLFSVNIAADELPICRENTSGVQIPVTRRIGGGRWRPASLGDQQSEPRRGIRRLAHPRHRHASSRGVIHDGNSLDLLGEKFSVVAVLPQTGTVDDSRIFAHLHTFLLREHVNRTIVAARSGRLE